MIVTDGYGNIFTVTEYTKDLVTVEAFEGGWYEIVTVGYLEDNYTVC
jgi:hypothetical protein